MISIALGFITNNIKPILIGLAVLSVVTLVKVIHFDVIDDLRDSNSDLTATIKLKDANITTLSSNIKLLDDKLENKTFKCKQKDDIIKLLQSKEKVEDVEAEKIPTPDVNGTDVTFG